MRKIYILAASAVLMALSAISANAQLKGNIFIHDPSTIAECDGKYYTFGTGSGGLISEDGYTWTGGGVRTGGGVAPDVIKIGDRYLVSYSAGFPGTEGKTRGNIITMWTKTLDPESPDFGYSDPMLVAWAEADEDCWAIDPAFLMGPDGKLWCSYGTYFGTIRICELDPKTGNRMPGDVATDVAIDCEATAMMYRNGWYYLLATHGTCCDGVNSTYNIVVGRSRNPRGPYYDNVGRDMMEGGGRMVLSAGNRVTGPGHFGHFVVDEGVERMSCHYEADMDLSGRSVLAINALQWRDDWPFVADQFKPGTFEIESVRRGYALEIAVDFVRMAGRSTRGFGSVNDPTFAIENQQLVDVIADWPKGEIGVRANDYMFRPHQRWTITPVEDAGAYLGFPYYKIEIEGTHRALAATEAEELITVPAFTGADEQLWRIDQLTDGTFRIMPKEVPGHTEPLALVSLGDNSKWNFRDR
ncbi:MAG: family 43 glycosylhydrolase [Bacteroidaceae bacterium]|nr:family 43 glycosylhydrolase [Bacteroidaceae bacterium]